MISKRKPLHVSAFQFRSSGSIAQNAAAILRGIKLSARKKCRLVVFQECAMTGYAGIDIESTDEINQKELLFEQRKIAAAALKHKLYVSLGTTSFIQKKVYNSHLLIGPDGKLKVLYHKQAMYGDDPKHYMVGGKNGIGSIDQWRSGLRVCFDFRFPEYFRQLLRAKVELALIGFSMVGKTSKKRAIAKAHLMSRAAENGLFIVAANNLWGKQNCPTCIISPDGELLAEASDKKETLITATLKPIPTNPLREAIKRLSQKLS